MNTKERILDEALTLFAEKGYTAVYVGDIAAAVGIKAPSLYKHYKSKRDIFQAILDRMQESYNAQAQQPALHRYGPRQRRRHLFQSPGRCPG